MHFTCKSVPPRVLHAQRARAQIAHAAGLAQQSYSAFTASFCEVGCILAWTPITESFLY